MAATACGDYHHPALDCQPVFAYIDCIMKNTKFLLIVLAGLLFGLTTLSAGETGDTAEKTWSRSLDISIGGLYAKSSDGSINIPAWAYSPMLTYNYGLSEDYGLGITLLKYTHFLADGTNPNLYSFAYGFTFTHWLPKKLWDLGAVKPWVAYSILLNQAFQEGTTGHGIAHDTRIAAGLDYILTPKFRLYSELVWDMSSFGSLGGPDLKYTSETAGFGLRLMM